MENLTKTFLKVVKIEAGNENEERKLKRPNVRIELQSRDNALLQKDERWVGGYLLSIDRIWELPYYVGIETLGHRQRSRPRPKVLHFEEEIGRGRFGEVFKAYYSGKLNPVQDKIVAVKRLKGRPTEEEITGFLSEIHIMKSLKHKNIIKLLSVSHRDCTLYAILEYASNGSLQQYIERVYSTKNDEYFAEHGGSVLRKMKSISVDVARGMNYLKRRSFVHRDLAARNVLIFEGLTAKIADFGLSRKFNKRGHDNGIQNDSDPLPINWMAPESLENYIFTTKSDVWSFGVLLWEIMSLGQFPCFFGVSGGKELASLLRAGRRLECPTGCPKQIYEFMLKCWVDDPASRPTFVEIMRDLYRFICPRVWQPRPENSINFVGYETNPI